MRGASPGGYTVGLAAGLVEEAGAGGRGRGGSGGEEAPFSGLTPRMNRESGRPSRVALVPFVLPAGQEPWISCT